MGLNSLVEDQVNKHVSLSTCKEHLHNEHHLHNEYNKVIFQNAHNLGIGEVLSYKQICETLHQDRYGGNQKKAQLKEFLRYFDFEYDKEIKKYLIKEVYDEPLPPSLNKNRPLTNRSRML